MLPGIASQNEKDNRKFYCILFGVILSAVGLGITVYYKTNNPPDIEGGVLIDAKQINFGNKTSNDSTLIFSTVIFRHGDRNPENSYQTDLHADGSSYSGGWAVLNLKGKRRMYSLGQHIRKKYSKFLPPLYMPDELYALSSVSERCIMSAECFLAALYPPLPSQKIHPELNWQPIPVHSVPFEKDNVVIAKNDCPRYTEALECVYSNTRSLEINTENGRLLRLLTEKSGQPVINYAHAWKLYNTLDLQKRLGLQLPEWVTKEVMQQMRQLAVTSLAAFTETPFMRKIRGGPLLDVVRQKMASKISKVNNKLKLFVVAAHDLTLVSLLRALGFSDVPWKPDFSATFLIELHKIHQQHVVQMWYSNVFDGNPKYEMLKLSNCDYSCPLDSFLEATNHLVPTDWHLECTSGPSDPVACPKL